MAMDDGVEGEAEAAGEAYRLHDQIGFLLRQANQRHIALFGSMMGDRLTTTQWSALVKLAELQPISQNQLGRETSMDVATIKGVVDRLVGRGFVRTAPDPKDGRRLVLAVTEEGARGHRPQRRRRRRGHARDAGAAEPRGAHPAGRTPAQDQLRRVRAPAPRDHRARCREII